MPVSQAFDRRYDVVIVGSRCAGAATALLLARKGLRTLVVDRGARGSDTLSTHALMRGGVLQLHRWGVLPAIVAAGTPAIRSTTFHYGDEALTLPISAHSGVDALFAPRRVLLDRVIVDAAEAAGAEVRFGVRAMGVLREAGQVRGIVVREESGGRHEIQSRLVVGADGVRSTVVDLVGADIYQVMPHATATVYAYWPGLHLDGYHWCYGPGIAAGAIPTNDGLTCVFVTSRASEFAARYRGRVEDGYHQALEQANPALARQVRTAKPAEGGFHGFPGHRGYFRRSSGPGWALVGDAGYFKDPLTAHGITDALRDAELLADAIADGSPAALAAYPLVRDQVARDVFALTDAIASFSWSLAELRVLHERLAKAMSGEVKFMTAHAAAVVPGGEQR